MTRYTEPVSYTMDLDLLSRETASFVTGIPESARSSVTLTMPRDEWEKLGLPPQICVTLPPGGAQ